MIQLKQEVNEKMEKAIICWEATKKLIDGIIEHDTAKIDSYFSDTLAEKGSAKLYFQEVQGATTLYQSDWRKNKERIEQIIQLIWEKGYEKHWEECHIWDDEFLEIAKIPVLLAHEFVGLLSGEYLVYLLHPDKIRFDIRKIVPLMPKQKDESKGEYAVRAKENAQAERDARHERFFGSGVQKRQDSYWGQVQKYVHRRLELDKSQRADIIELLQEYGYVKENLGPFLNVMDYNNEAYFENIIKPLKEKQIAFILFRTLLWQHLGKEERQSVLGYSIFLFWVRNEVYLGLRNKIMPLHEVGSGIPDSNVRQQLFLMYSFIWRKYIQDICQQFRSREKAIYKTYYIYWQIFLGIMQWQNFKYLAVQSVNEYKVLQHLSHEVPFYKLQESIMKNYHSDNKQCYFVDIRDKNKFFIKYKELINLVWDKEEQVQIKKSWWKIMTMLIYLKPEIVGLDLKKCQLLPRTLSAKWLKESNLHLDEVPLKDIVATMVLVDRRLELSDINLKNLWGKQYKNKSQYNSLKYILGNIRNFLDDDDMMNRLRRMVDCLGLFFMLSPESAQSIEDMMVWNRKVLGRLAFIDSPVEMKKFYELILCSMEHIAKEMTYVICAGMQMYAQV